MITTQSGVDVTLTVDMFRRLRHEARSLGVPIEWLIASLIVDTMETVDSVDVAA